MFKKIISCFVSLLTFLHLYCRACGGDEGYGEADGRNHHVRHPDGEVEGNLRPQRESVKAHPTPTTPRLGEIDYTLPHSETRHTSTDEKTEVVSVN